MEAKISGLYLFAPMFLPIPLRWVGKAPRRGKYLSVFILHSHKTVVIWILCGAHAPVL
jgi:hypothetical protein